jgi:hypothetical protein
MKRTPLSEVLKKQSYETLEPLEYLLQDKIGYIQFCFSKELTEAQFKRVTKDTELIKAVHAHISRLDYQVNFLLSELKKEKQFAHDCHAAMSEAQEENMKLLFMAAKERLKAFNFEEL